MTPLKLPACSRPSRACALFTCLLALAVQLLGCGKSNEPEFSRVTTSGVACTDGRVACGDSCVRVESSPEHCGACGRSCAEGTICDRGSCQPLERGCSDRLSLCGAACVDAASDGDHCGGCGQACAAEASCDLGSCVCPGTAAACGSECVDTQSDEDNCGACGSACVDIQTCEAGRCECPGAGELCDGSCVDLATDSRHCGACGRACTGGQICSASDCVCPPGQTLCDDICVDLQTDSAHCGACGSVCSGGQLCAGGSCECPDRQEFCDGTCLDVQTDIANCGGCGMPCAFGDGCSGGTCASGALGSDGCEGLADNLSISQVAAYQTVKSEIARDGAAVTPPTTSVVAGRPTLLRVFVTPGPGWVARELSARLHLENGAAIETRYSESKLTISRPSSEDDRNSAFEFKVAGEGITSATRYAVEIVECGTGQAGAGPSTPRFPASDGIALGAVDTGPLRVRVIPLRTNDVLPDTSEDAIALYRRAFLATYPISSVDFTVADPVDVDDPEDWSNNLDGIRALRQQDAPSDGVYYYGMLKPTDTLRQFCGNGCVAGIGYIPPGARGAQNASGRAAMGLAYGDDQSAFTMLHEIGHNHGRQHAPCAPGGSIAGVDPNYPYQGASIGVYGYVSLSDQLISPDSATDVMGYCDSQWFSDYTYRGLMNTVLALNTAQASIQVEASRIGSWRVMLIDPIHGSRWGIPISGPEVAVGEAETATVRDGAGAVLRQVTVYRTEMSDIGAFSIEVPEPEPGWASIEVAGAPALDFRP